MDKQQKRKRKQYLSDFRPAVNGEYVYTGDHFRPDMEGERFAVLRRSILIMLFLSAAFVFTAGLLPAAGSTNCFYVILPFLAVIICCFIKTLKTVRLFASGLTVREYVYEKTVPAIPRWLLAEGISAAATLAAEAVYLIVNGFDGRETYTAAFICLITALIAADLIMLKFFREITWCKKSTK
ncbi:MAG: hypothetical protein IJH53_08795 [Oscillospiraceae bacterium]|nr:hypothetical protein [Oscillospiraceae bacterium]